MTIEVVYGRAEMLGDEFNADRIRTYLDDEGNVWTGTETTDVDYYCSRDCAERSLPWLTLSAMQGIALRAVFANAQYSDFKTAREHGNAGTADAGTHYGDFPDYSVYCARCGDTIHQGDDE